MMASVHLGRRQRGIGSSHQTSHRVSARSSDLLPFLLTAQPRRKNWKFLLENHAATNIGRILAPLRRAPSPRTTTTRLGWESCPCFWSVGPLASMANLCRWAGSVADPSWEFGKSPRKPKCGVKSCRPECSMSWHQKSFLAFELGRCTVVAAGQHLPPKGWLSESCWCWLPGFSRFVICALLSILVPGPSMVNAWMLCMTRAM